MQCFDPLLLIGLSRYLRVKNRLLQHKLDHLQPRFVNLETVRRRLLVEAVRNLKEFATPGQSMKIQCRASGSATLVHPGLLSQGKRPVASSPEFTAMSPTWIRNDSYGEPYE